jgi:hypothetical protein
MSSIRIIQIATATASLNDSDGNGYESTRLYALLETGWVIFTVKPEQKPTQWYLVDQPDFDKNITDRKPL